MEYIILWTCTCIVVYNLIPRTPTKATIHPHAPTDPLLSNPLGVQREDTAFRLAYMSEIVDGHDLLDH